jgi:hypothetical protein
MRQCFLLLLIFLAAQLVYAQETTKDNGIKLDSDNAIIKLQTSLNEFDIYRELNYMRMNLSTNDDPNTIWMWTKLSITANESSNNYSGESPGSMLEPLHQQFLENSRLNPVRYVLGIAQTAAVGYLAYQHIKKYGLFK